MRPWRPEVVIFLRIFHRKCENKSPVTSTTPKLVLSAVDSSKRVLASPLQMTAPERPSCENPTEISIDVVWKKVPDATAYKVVYREFPKPWETAKVLSFSLGELTETDSGYSTTVEELAPTSTYQVRLVAVFADGKESEPSEETTVDTQVGNCLPEKKEKKCVIC